jgi:hypothetical protein
MDIRRRKLSYANVAATLALVLALSGAAVAAATVTSGDIVNKTIKVVDISPKARKALLPESLQAYKNDAGAFSGNSETVLGTLGLPKGNWVVVAKLWVRNDGSAATDVLCALRAGADFDNVWSRIGPGGEISTPGFTLMHSGADRAQVICNANGGTMYAADLKITAVKVGKTTKLNLSGP